MLLPPPNMATQQEWNNEVWKYHREIDNVNSWTPTFSFGVNGDLSIVYGTQIGRYIKLGKLVIASFNVTTTSFTYSTSSGGLIISGLPYLAEENDLIFHTQSIPYFYGLTLNAGYTSISGWVYGGAIALYASGSGKTTSHAINSTHTASGTNIAAYGTISYFSEV